MPTKSPQQAVQLYADFLNSVLNRTITDSRLSVLTTDKASRFQLTRFQDGKRLSLDLKPSGQLLFRQTVEAPEGKVIVLAASYQYFPADADIWLFRYDYELQPSKDLKPKAHLHVNASWETKTDLSDMHFPTGRISIERVIAHLIVEHNISPKSEIAEVIPILEKSHAGFFERRSDTESSLL